jgi:hypothetical protein
MDFVFSGGGIRAVAYFGVLDRLREHGLLVSDMRFFCTSMASIVTSLYKIDPSKALGIFLKLPFDKIRLRPSINGFYDMSKYKKELFNIFGDMFIATSDITLAKFDKNKSFIPYNQDISRVSDLFVNTITIPILVKPTDILYDGGVVNNFPREKATNPIEIDINGSAKGVLRSSIRSVINAKSIGAKYRLSIPNQFENLSWYDKFSKITIFDGILKNRSDLRYIMKVCYNFGLELGDLIIHDMELKF